MKVGIITVHDSANFGSYLQAYAMQEALRSLGHDPFFVKTRSTKSVKRIFYRYPISRQSLTDPIGVIKKYVEGIKKYKKFAKELELLKEISVDRKDELDKILLGSDEIWNINIPTFKNPIFYGHDMDNISAYAVSMGNADVEQYKNYPVIVSSIKSVEKLFVRDKKTQMMVEEITGRKPEIVCDPTFLIPIEKFNHGYRDEYLDNNPFVLVYSYEVGINENLKNAITLFAAEHNLKIVAVCFNFAWADYYVNCSPLEFCSVIDKAQYVVTTTFHGSIFSFLNHKQFVCLPYSIKTNDVLELVGLEEVIVDINISAEEFIVKLDSINIDYNAVDTKVAELREKCLIELNSCVCEKGNE